MIIAEIIYLMASIFFFYNFLICWYILISMVYVYNCKFKTTIKINFQQETDVRLFEFHHRDRKRYYRKAEYGTQVVSRFMSRVVKVAVIGLQR